MNPTMLHGLRMRKTGPDGLPAPKALAELESLQSMSKTFATAQARFEKNRLMLAKRALVAALRSVHSRFPSVGIEAFGIGYGYRIVAEGRTFDRSETPHYINNRLQNGVIISGRESRPAVDGDIHFALCPALRMMEAFELAGICDPKWAFKVKPVRRRKAAAATAR